MKPQFVDWASWRQCTDIVQSAYMQASRHQPLDLDSLRSAAKIIVNMVRTEARASIWPAGMTQPSIQEFAIETNAAIHAVRTASNLGYHALQLRNFAIGCMLRNIGSGITGVKCRQAEAGFAYLSEHHGLHAMSTYMVFHETRSPSTFEAEGEMAAVLAELAEICDMSVLFERKSHEYESKASRRVIVEMIQGLSGNLYSSRLANVFCKSVVI